MSKRNEIYRYLEWLMQKCTSSTNKRLPDPYAYRMLFYKMLITPFEYSDYGELSHDENRVKDALYMRHEYENEHSQIAGLPCSILEVLIALAVRIETDVMQDICHPDRTAMWFWLMVSNLGLAGREFQDDLYTELKVNDVLKRFLRREYEKDGSNGGIFQLKKRGIDMRKIELWYQMELYFARYRDDFA